MFVQNCVLEGSRLDFGGPRPRFGRVWGRFFRDFRKFWGTLPRSSPSSDPSSSSSRNPCQWTPQESPRMASNRPMPRTPKTPRTPRAKIASPERSEAKGGWAAVIPRGVVQSAAHRRWCRACWIPKAMYAKFNKILALCSASKSNICAKIL